MNCRTELYSISLYGSILSLLSGFCIGFGESMFFDIYRWEIKETIKRSLGLSLITFGIYIIVPGSLRRIWI